MGKDIHTLIEIKENDLWKPVEDELDRFDGRSYRFFGILEDNFGRRGIPKELEGKKFKKSKYEEDYWGFDFTADWMFGYSYVLLKELRDYYNNLNKVTVSEEFLEKFFELGGVLPEGMSLEKEDGKIYVEPLDEEDIWFYEFFDEGIKEIERIAEKYNVTSENIRMVFAFDW